MTDLSTIPNVIFLKKQAKALKKEIRQQQPSALSRMTAVFGDRRQADDICHADCLHIIAQEQGHPSWQKLVLAIEIQTANRQQRLSALRMALFQGHRGKVSLICQLDPSLMDADFGMALSFAQPDIIQQLQKSPEMISQEVAGHHPLYYLCYSPYYSWYPETQQIQLDVLQYFYEQGADLNQLLTLPGTDHRQTVLYGAIGHCPNPDLAQKLLSLGADPNDNECLYHATEWQDHGILEALFAAGAKVGTTNALFRLLDHDSSTASVDLFLSHGADPTVCLGNAQDQGPSPLHHAILQGRSVAICQMLIAAGAKIDSLYRGHNCLGLAYLAQNNPIITFLTKHYPHLFCQNMTEQAIYEILSGQAAATCFKIPDGSLFYDLIGNYAQSDDNMSLLKILAACQQDLSQPDCHGLPPLHHACWWGQAAIVAYLCQQGISLTYINQYGGDALGTAIHGSSHCPARSKGDYKTVIASLLAHGAIIKADQGHLDMGDAVVSQYLESYMAEDSSEQMPENTSIAALFC